MSSYTDVAEFWEKRKSVAFFGLSRNKAFPNHAYRMLTNAGYELVAVHPEAPVIEGIVTVGSLGEITTVLDGAVIVAGRKTTLNALEACSERDIRSVLVQSDGWSEDARAFCQDNGIAAVSTCVFLQHGMGFPHNLHRWIAQTFLS